MKNLVGKSNLPKQLPPVLSIVAYLFLTICIYLICYKLPIAWVGENFSRKTAPLRYDSLTLLGYSAALICLSLLWKHKYLAVVTAITLTLSVVSIVSSWLYYDFYKDFVAADTLLLIPDLINGGATGGLSSLASSEAALMLVYTYVAAFVLWLILLLKKVSRSERRNLAAAIMVFILLGGINQYKFHQVDSESILTNASVPPINVNPSSYFFRSFFVQNIKLKFESNHTNAARIFNENPLDINYPLYKQLPDYSHHLYDVNKKNVILLVLESMRSAEIGAFNDSIKKSTTPNIDKIAKQTDTFVNYYSNTVQTVRAEVSILCSIFDFSRGTPISRRGVELNTLCLPSILKQQGYTNIWIHGNEKDYFNRDNLFPSIGFDELHDEKTITSKNIDSEILGWGVSDKDTLNYAFDLLEKKDKPFFAQILTLSNHFPFDFGFDESILESNENTDVYNQFLRGVQYTDKQVGLFWERFQNSTLKENTILIITSDHGLWFQEKKFKDNYSANEALFKVPLMIWNPEKKAASKYRTVASHIDLTPSILEMLNIYPKDSAFMGENIYSENRRELALMTGFGAYAARTKNKFCFPLTGSKENGYYVEKRIDNPHNVGCLPSRGKPFKQSFLTPQDSFTVPPKEYRDIIELNDISLLKGFVPGHLLEKNANPEEKRIK